MASASPASLVFEHTASGYVAHGAGYDLRLGRTSHSLRFLRPDGRAAIVQTELVGARKDLRLEAGDPDSGKANYLIGSDPAQWRTGQPTYRRVYYHGIYKDIDLVFHGDTGRFEYDFEVRPGADPGRICLNVRGASNLHIDAAGDLVISTGDGEVRWKKPELYQFQGATHRPVEGRFVLDGSTRVRFAVGSYDRTRELVIDPVINYATYLGAKSNDAARGIVVDSSGNIYISGNTTSDNLPKTAGTVQPAYGGENNMEPDTGDGFIAKFNAQGALVFITYLGGRATDNALDLALDSAGNLYVTGFTTSNNFPVTANAFQTTYKGGDSGTIHVGGDAFVAKLNPAGSQLLYSTYLGGTLGERGLAIAVDSAGNAYVAGNTVSPTGFPVTGSAYQKVYGGGSATDIIAGGDAFVAKLNSTGSALTWATYLGGTAVDTPSDIAMDASGNLWITGYTLSANFPVTTDAFQKTYGGQAPESLQQFFPLGDVFLTKMSPDGASLLYSTYFGGNRDEAALGLFLDPQSNVYLTGFTSSTNFPVTTGAAQSKYAGPDVLTPDRYFTYGDAFAAKFNSAGVLQYSTLFGGAKDDGGFSIVADAAGNAWIGGVTASSDLPVTTDAFQKTFGGFGGQFLPTGDGFLAKVNPTGTAVLFSSYFGGNMDDAIAGLTITPNGTIYATGTTNSTTGFPVTNDAAIAAFQGGSQDIGLVVGDAFLARILDPQVEPEPNVKLAAVANAASYSTGGVAPGEIIILYGSGMAGGSLTTAQLDGEKLKTTLDNTRILFDDVPSALVYTSATQSATVVPYEVAGKGSVNIVVEHNGEKSKPLSVPVLSAHPGLFSADSTGAGPGAIFNEDGPLNTPANPAQLGHIVVLYGTGEGQTDPPGVDGQLAIAAYPKPVLPLEVTVGGIPIPAEDILYIGAVPYQTAGLFQLNIRLPKAGLAAGNQDVVVKFGGQPSKANLTVAVKP